MGVAKASTGRPGPGKRVDWQIMKKELRAAYEDLLG